MIKIKYCAVLVVLILTSGLFAGNNDKPVAKIGKRNISLTEFIQRFELTPWNKQISSMPVDISKEQFLYTLIAEKLWAQKAVDLGYDTSQTVRENLKSLEKLFVRDALYRLEIMDKVNVTDKDMQKAYKRAHSRLSGDFLSSDNEEEISGLYKALRSGASFDSLFAARRKEVIKDTLSVFMGKFDEALEDSLYNMKPGSFTAPVNWYGAWYIIRINNTRYIIPGNSREEDAIVKDTYRILKERQTSNYYNEFVNKFFEGKKTSINGKALHAVASEIIDAIQGKQKLQSVSNPDKIYLDPGDFIKIRRNLEQKKMLEIPLIRFENRNASVAEFLNEMNYNDNAFSTTEESKIRGIIENRLKSFMQNEYLALEGFNRGLQNLPEVKNQIQIWKDSYMYLALRNSFNDSLKVSDQELLEYYNKRKNLDLPEEVNIVEVLTDNLDIVEKVLDEYSRGTDMHELAKKYSKREMTKHNNGEFGFFPVTSYGEIGKIAGTLNVGDVYGPLKVPEGYSVFKVIDKKQNRTPDPRSFAESKEELRKSLSGLKSFHKLVNYTVKLANEYGVTVDKEVLNSAHVTTIFSVMYRFIGFGGKILAVPLTSPNTEWVKPWQNSKPETP